MQKADPDIRLHHIYASIAREHGFRTWQAMKNSLITTGTHLGISENITKIPYFLNRLFQTPGIEKIHINRTGQTIITLEGTGEIKIVNDGLTADDANNLFETLRKMEEDQKPLDLNPAREFIDGEIGSLYNFNAASTNVIYAYTPDHTSRMAPVFAFIRRQCEEKKPDMASIITITKKLKATVSQTPRNRPTVRNPEIWTLLSELLAQGCNVMISGSTMSGKTNLLSNILNQAPLTARIASLSGTQEFSIRQPNHLNGHFDRHQRNGTPNALDVMTFMLRSGSEILSISETSMTTDHRIIISIINSFASNAGVITTIHAHSPTAAIQRIKTLIEESMADFPPPLIKKMLSQLSERLFIIQIARGDQTFSHIDEILCPAWI